MLYTLLYMVAFIVLGYAALSVFIILGESTVGIINVILDEIATMLVAKNES